jgi:hypothetical protein
MIYLFGQGKSVSIIYDASTLTAQDKVGGIAIEQLPTKEDREGFNAVLCLDQNNQPYWEYEEIQQDTLEDLVRKNLLTKEQYEILTGKEFNE